MDGLAAEIETLKLDLSNEKPLLTKELIAEREEDIEIKVKEFERLQLAYFGPTGDLFQLRKQLAEPVQNQVYNSVRCNHHPLRLHAGNRMNHSPH